MIFQKFPSTSHGRIRTQMPSEPFGGISLPTLRPCHAVCYDNSYRAVSSNPSARHCFCCALVDSGAYPLLLYRTQRRRFLRASFCGYRSLSYPLPHAAFIRSTSSGVSVAMPWALASAISISRNLAISFVLYEEEPFQHWSVLTRLYSP